MLMLMKINKIQFGSGLVKPAIFLFLGLASLIIVSLIGHTQLNNFPFNANSSANLNIMDKEKKIYIQTTEEMDKAIKLILSNNFNATKFSHHVNQLNMLSEDNSASKSDVIADYIKNVWISQGIQYTYFKDYSDISLNYPNNENSSKIEIVNENGQPTLVINNAFILHATNGTLLGELVYANFGRKEDYDNLKLLNINTANKIVLIRYRNFETIGAIINAQKRGVLGIILYNDMHNEQNFLPYATLSYTIRTSTELIKIPVLAIGNHGAKHLLKLMDEIQVASQKQTHFNIKNFNAKLTLHVPNNKINIRNVIAQIDGFIEPDRYIIVGTHFDKSPLAKKNANFEVALLMEMSASLMRAYNEIGWRPRRTIMFCAWDAHEHGFLGSMKWIEEMKHILNSRGLVYLNLGSVQDTQQFRVESSPAILRSVISVTQEIANPNVEELLLGYRTLFDSWYNNTQNNETFFSDFPKNEPILPDSDHFQFINYLGIPVLNFGYYKDVGTTMRNKDKNGRTTTKVLKSLSQLWSRLIYMFSDGTIIPMNSTDYANYLIAYIDNLETKINKASKVGVEVLLQIHHLKQVAIKFFVETRKFHEYISDPKETKSSVIIEMLNNRLSTMEKCFVNEYGLKTRPTSRHLVFGANTVENNDHVFPGVISSFVGFKLAESEVEKVVALNELKKQLDILHFSFQCATQMLRKAPN